MVHFSDSIVVDMIRSFPVICLIALYTQNGLSERDNDACLETYLTIRILHLALTVKIDISDSRAVIRYVERQNATCTFRVTSVSMHKMLYRKVVAFRV